MSVYQTRLRRGGIFGLIGSLLILAGCATHHNESTTASLPDEGPFRVEQDLRFSPDGWPEALFADLYLPTGQASEARHPVVLMVHVLRNSMIPVVTVIALNVPQIFSGAIITEQVFKVNGLGSLLILGIQGADVPLVQTLTFVFAVLIVLFNLIADILYGILDPRIRYD